MSLLFCIPEILSFIIEKNPWLLPWTRSHSLTSVYLLEMRKVNRKWSFARIKIRCCDRVNRRMLRIFGRVGAQWGSIRPLNVALNQHTTKARAERLSRAWSDQERELYGPSNYLLLDLWVCEAAATAARKGKSRARLGPTFFSPYVRCFGTSRAYLRRFYTRGCISVEPFCFSTLLSAYKRLRLRSHLSILVLLLVLYSFLAFSHKLHFSSCSRNTPLEIHIHLCVPMNVLPRITLPIVIIRSPQGRSLNNSNGRLSIAKP